MLSGDPGTKLPLNIGLRIWCSLSYSSAKKFKLIGEPEETGSFFRVRRFMEERLGSDLALSPWDGEVKLPYDTISEETREILSSAFPTMKISYDILSRFMASIGRGSTEVLLAREGLIEPVDAVLHTGYDALGDLLPSLGSRNIRAVIRGGGTGVTEGLRRRKKGILVAIDTTSLKNIEIGKNWIRVGSGWKGKELEGLLNQRGYTMGNFPESLADSTIGGWLSTKASGQESNSYGDIEDMVISLDLYRSDFTLKDSHKVRESSGMTSKDIAVGGEGRNGIVGDITMKIHPAPGRRHYGSFFFRSFQEGVEALSKFNHFPSVVRLHDQLETQFLLSAARDSTMKRALLKWMEVRGIRRGSGSLAIMVDNGKRLHRPIGSVSSGKSIARMWEKNRFGRPDIGNGLWRMGLVPDTLETSATWERIMDIYEATRRTFSDECRELRLRGEIMAHISHLYETGAAIYFTFVITPGKGSSDLIRLRRKLVQGFIENGGAITHHHGIGTEFASLVDEGRKALFSLVEDPVLGD